MMNADQDKIVRSVLGRVRSRVYLPLLIKPCLRFSRTRLSDVLHCKACAFVQPADVGTLYRLYLPYNRLDWETWRILHFDF